MSQPHSYSVAIVGLGPRGTYALERLLAHAGGLPTGTSLRVTAFEPHPRPGAGPIYDPSQPQYLRMNFAAEMIDARWPRPGPKGTASLRSFSEWRGEEGRGASEPERYPARARVGSYLEWVLGALLAATPPNVEIAIDRSRVSRIRRERRGWLVAADAESARGEHFDEVLLTTGHLPPARPGGPIAAPADELERIDSVFPVERLSGGRIPAGCGVAVRGFALTFIDAALALSEGRGGAFIPAADTGDPALTYQPGGDEPAVLLPFSRSGRPMLAKPDPDLIGSLGAAAAVAESARAELAAGPAPFTIAQLSRGLVSTAQRLLAAADPGRSAEAESEQGPDEALRQLLSHRSQRGAGGRSSAALALALLQRSIAIGAGLLPPDALWALGESWRSLYPAIVERVGRDGLAAEQWPAFLRLAAEMERIAFGPPIANAAKLAALIEAGLVDLSLCAGGRIEARSGSGAVLAPGIGSEATERPIDVLLDAVSPPPGARHLAAGPIGELLVGGHLRVPENRRGIEIAADATCIGASGECAPGLAAIGRLTEDWVIGNDTLSRKLHPHADAWARGLLDRVRSRADTAPEPATDPADPKSIRQVPARLR